MALEMPRAKDLFGDVSAKAAAEKMEDYTSTLSQSLSKSVAMPGQQSSTTSAIEALVANKSLAPDVLSSLNTALSAQRGAMGDVVKDISLTSPLSSSFAAFDLEAPAKLLTPRPTPLRNRIPRKKGVGTAHRIKRVLGYTGTGTGGVGNTWPGITETTTTSFGSVAYERGPKISYAADDLVLPYQSFSLSDSVSFDANFSGLGFQDLRQLSSTSTLYATMLMEERMMLMARGTATGFGGALSAPTVTLTKPSAGTGQVALTDATYYVYVTADAGISTTGFGESIVSTVQSQSTTSQVLKIVVGDIAGALGYNVYVGTTTGTANAKYQGTFKGNTAYVVGAGSTKVGDTIVYSTASSILASRANADTSAYATGYDGILPTLLNPSLSGSINDINAAFSTSNPGVEYQTVFSALYDAVKADPDEILINGSDRRQLSDAIKSGSTANYRLAIENPGEGGITYGSVVTGLQNEVTGKAVNLVVHPWLPSGVSPVMSYTLPIPDTQVSDVWSNYMVQDYMGISWPVNQFSYDFSTYFRGVFMCQAPAWNGIVSGIVSA